MIETWHDVEASLADFGSQFTGPPMLKTGDDVLRYEMLLDQVKPDLIVETGTWAGLTAAWFAGHGPEVITIDRAPRYTEQVPGVVYLTGDSVDPSIVGTVLHMAHCKRTMVVLDSDHSARHVAAEIAAYGDLVTPGCHLVVEDGLIHWMHLDPAFGQWVDEYDGSPLDAIELELAGNDEWRRDTDVETLTDVTQHPAGWWVKL